MTVGLDRLGQFETFASEGFLDWLRDENVALVFGRRNEMVLIGRSREDDLRIDTVSFDRVGGMALYGATLWIGTGFQIWRYENGLAPGASTDDGCDLCLLPRVGATTGAIVADDLAVRGDGEVLFASGRFSCIGTIADGMSFTPLWLPAWVTELVDETRSPVSGIAMRDGECAFVTVLGTSDEPDGWHAKGRGSSGLIVDVHTDRVVAKGLAMPYSPRWHEDRLWFCDAGRGRLCALDVETGDIETIAEMPTFLRGLEFVGPWAIVAGSASRSDELLEGLPIADTLAATSTRPEQGLWVIDTRTGEIAHRLRIDGTGREVFSVVAFADTRRVKMFSPDDNELQTVISYDRSWTPGTSTPGTSTPGTSTPGS
jgi:uncharacterized protein (TIGR03032 family)